MTGRCTCVMLPTDPPKWDGRQCRVHGTDVDAILASGHYIDRKGRTWRHRFRLWAEVFSADPWSSPVLTPAQMRTLIVRDQHRAVCPGLRECFTHPVPQVFTDEDGGFCAHPALGGPDLGTWHATLGAALDAARNITGATP